MGDPNFPDKFDNLLKSSKKKGIGPKGYEPTIKNFREKREAYEEGLNKNLRSNYPITWISSRNVKDAFDLDFLSSEKKEYLNFIIGGIAKKYLETSKKNKNALDLVTSVSLYDSIGKNNNATKSKVFSVFKEIYPKGYFDLDNLKMIRNFLAKGENKNIERKVGGAFAIIGIVGGLIFLAPTLTANVVGNLTNSTSSWIGGILFVLGIVGAFFYFKRM